MRIRRLVRVISLTLVALSVSVCGSSSDDSPTTNITLAPTTSASIFRPTTSTTISFQELAARLFSPESAAIADDLRTLSGKSVTVANVDALATSVCTSGFRATSVISYFRNDLSIRFPFSTLTVSNRLLTRASHSQICQRPPSTIEIGVYRNDMWSYVLSSSGPTATAFTLPPLNVASFLPKPDPLEDAVCTLLDKGGSVVESGLQELLMFASRGRIDGGDLLAVTVEIAGASCQKWFPYARDIYRRYLGS